MALHVVGAAKSEISALLQNLDLDTVTNVNGALERAARTCLNQADIPEASGAQPITLYGGVYWYPAPDTIFGGAINMVRRQGDANSPLDFSYKIPLEDFSRQKGNFGNGFTMALQYKNGEGQIGISSPIPFPQAIIDPMNSTDGWTAAGSASGLTQDVTNYWQPPASLRFLLTGSSTGTLTKTLTNSNDWSDYQGVGVAFLALQIPAGTDPTDLTSVALRLGSDSGNYSEVSATTGFLGAWVANDWLLVALDQAAATDTGTPDWSAIDYVQVRLAHTATMVNFRVGGLWLALPSPCEILFQSSAIFLNSSGVPVQTIPNDSATIMLNDAAYNLFIYESALTISMQQGGSLASNYTGTFKTMLYEQGGLYEQYRADNPSGELRTVGSYYTVYGNGYRNGNG